jgi:hypothetical protein
MHNFQVLFVIRFASVLARLKQRLEGLQSFVLQVFDAFANFPGEIRQASCYAAPRLLFNKKQTKKLIKGKNIFASG